MVECWLSVQGTAVHLGVNRDTIYDWIERKEMRAHKAGRLWKFPASGFGTWPRKGAAGQREA